MVSATLLALFAWWLLSRDDEAPQPETEHARKTTEGPPSTSQLPATPMNMSSDAGAWNVEVLSTANGAPLAGARVNVGRGLHDRYIHHYRPPVFNGETDAHGHVLVEEPYAGEDKRPLMVEVFLPYFRKFEGAYVPGMRVMLAPLSPWHGQVSRSNGQPAAGARVVAVDAENLETQTAKDGSFELALPWPGRVLVALDGELAMVQARDGEFLEITLGVAPERQGVVVGRDLQPLAGVTMTWAVQAFSLVRTTGADGVYRVPSIEDLDVMLRFEKEGYVPVETPIADEVIMSRPSRLEGTLIDQRGRPMPGVEVERGSDLAGIFIEDVTVKSDELGHFVFDDVTDEEVQLQAWPGDGSEQEAARLTVQVPEGAVTHVTLAMPPPRDEFAVTYVSTAEVEVEDCNVLANPVPPLGWNSSTRGDRGLMLTRGRFHFEVVCDDGRTADELREVDPRADTRIRFVVRGPDGGTPFRDELPPDVVRVKVVNQSGAPVAGAAVDCADFAHVETDAEGRATCEVRADDSAWPMIVTATKDAATGTVRTPGKDEAVVVIRSRVTLRGRIDGPIPPGNWSVAVRSTNETSDNILVGSSFALEGRPAIRTFICIEPVGHPAPGLGCAISEAGEEVVIRSGAPGKFSFTAIDASGAPIANPIVYFDRHMVYLRPNDIVNGVVQLDAPPGEHVVILNVDDSRARNEVKFTVKSGELTALGALKLE